MQHAKDASGPLLAFSDKKSWDELKAQALRKASELRDKAANAAQQNLRNAQVMVRDLAASRSPQEAGVKLKGFWLSWKTKNSQILARLFVALYFLNQGYASYETWSQLKGYQLEYGPPIGRPNTTPAHYVSSAMLLIMLLSALLIMCGYAMPAAASCLTGSMLISSARLVWEQTLMMIRYNQRPNELAVKRLAVLGSTLCLLACSLKENPKLRNYATGLLFVDEDNKPGFYKSFLLLVGRLLVSVLFLFVGFFQMQRVVARDYELWVRHSLDHWASQDGHDNNWLLLEFLFSLPFAVGYKTEATSQLLCLTLVMEAVTCWPFWSASWPSWQYTAHVRSHFFTNLAVAGGLLLMQRAGGGRFTVDRLIHKKLL